MSLSHQTKIEANLQWEWWCLALDNLHYLHSWWEYPLKMSFNKRYFKFKLKKRKKVIKIRHDFALRTHVGMYGNLTIRKHLPSSLPSQSSRIFASGWNCPLLSTKQTACTIAIMIQIGKKIHEKSWALWNASFSISRAPRIASTWVCLSSTP